MADLKAQIVKTEKGFSLIYQGIIKDIPVKFMRISEANGLQDLFNDVINETIDLVR